MNILFASQVEKAEDWLPLLEKALPQDRFFAAPEKDIVSWDDLDALTADLAVQLDNEFESVGDERTLNLNPRAGFGNIANAASDCGMATIEGDNSRLQLLAARRDRKSVV